MLMEKRPLSPEPFLNRLFKRPYRGNLAIELHNLIATTDVDGISEEEIVQLEARYRCPLRKLSTSLRTELFTSVLTGYLKDHRLSEQERANLVALRELLELPQSVTRAIREEVLSSMYKERAEAAVSDGVLTPEQQQELQEFADAVALPEELSKSIYNRAAGERVQAFLEQAVSNEMLSPEEDSEFQALARNLRVDMTIPEKTAQQLERYRLYWQIENGEIPAINVGIRLYGGEVCYHYCPVSWYEFRQVTRRVNFGGPVLRLKITRGLYWRAGSLGVQRVTEDILKYIDEGTLFLTNRRLIFMGSKGSKNIRLNRILDFEIFSNGVQIQKDAGASPFLKTDADMELFGLLMGRALRDVM